MSWRRGGARAAGGGGGGGGLPRSQVSPQLGQPLTPSLWVWLVGGGAPPPPPPGADQLSVLMYMPRIQLS